MDTFTVRASSSSTTKRFTGLYQVVKRWLSRQKKARIARITIYLIAIIVLLGFTIRDMYELIIQYEINEPVTNAEVASNQTLRFPPLTVCIEPKWSIEILDIQKTWEDVEDKRNQQVHAILNAAPTDHKARYLTMLALEDLYNMDSAFIQGSNNESYMHSSEMSYALGLRATKINNLTLPQNTKDLQNVANSLMQYMCAVLEFSEDESFRFVFSVNTLTAIDRCAELLQQKMPYIITTTVFCLDIPLNFKEKEKTSATYAIGTEWHTADMEKEIQAKLFPMSSANYSVPTKWFAPPKTKPQIDGARVYFAADSRHLVQLVDIEKEETAFVTIPYDTWASINLKIGSQFVMSSDKCSDDSISNNECDMVCRARLTDKLCGCWPFSLRHFMPETVVKFCGVNDYKKCVARYKQRVHTCKDKCNVCTKNVYSTSMSTGKGNYGAGFQIVCDTFTFPRFVQRPSFTRSSFLAQAGGIIGLYLGASWLSLVLVIIIGLKLAKSRAFCTTADKQQQLLPLSTLYWMLNAVLGEGPTSDDQNVTTSTVDA